MSLRQAVESKGARAFGDRVLGLPGRFGLSTARMDQRLRAYLEVCGEFGVVPTLPMTAVVLDRHPEVIHRMLAEHVEFAVHGLVHDDHLAASGSSQLTSVREAVETFHRHQVPVVGFRAPYLRADGRTRAAVRAAGLLYDSSQAVEFPVLPVSQRGAGGTYARAIEFYRAHDSARVVTRPRLMDGIVSIPVAVPDDEILVDRLRLPAHQQVLAWDAILRTTHERNELFTLQLHPERLETCREALRVTLATAAGLPGGIWTAPLGEVAHWWRVRSRVRVQVDRSGPLVHVRVDAGPRVTVQLLARPVGSTDHELTSPGAPLVSGMTLTTRRDPVVAVPADAPAGVTEFLREEGFVLAPGADAARCGAIVIDPDPGDEQKLLAQVLAGPGPLVRVARWPDGHASALAVTGDIDSLTLADFALRQVETRHPEVPRQRRSAASSTVIRSRGAAGGSRPGTVVIGAGPYGLAAAAHLSAVGPAPRVYGTAMSFWESQMPEGMLLRSPWAASSISDPRDRLTLDRFCADTGTAQHRPMPLKEFVSYGRWFQRKAVPQLEDRHVAELRHEDGGLTVVLSDGETVPASRVVVATGIDAFAALPPVVAGLPAGSVSHSRELRDPTGFAGKTVVVVGAGQSALESAALLHEAGARVTVVVRAPTVHWLGRSARLHSMGPVTRLLYAPSDVGPAGLSRLVAAPDLFRRVPRPLQDRMAKRSTRPAGAAWLPARLADVPIMVGRSVVRADAAVGRVCLTLDDGTALDADHVLCATGYRVDLGRLGLLPTELRSRIAATNGYPRLGRGFASSVPGLHFVGATAAWSYGPLMRFVAGTPLAARAVAQATVSGRT